MKLKKIAAIAAVLALFGGYALATSVTGLTWGSDPPGVTTGVVPKDNGTNDGHVTSSALIDNGTIVSSSESVDIQNNALLREIANAGTTGTTLNTLAKLTGAPSTAVIMATTDTSGKVGIVTGGAGTTGNAQIAVEGIAACLFDGNTTSVDYVTISSTNAGFCHDAGATKPTSGDIVGRVMATATVTVGTTTVNVSLFPPGVAGVGSGSGSFAIVGTSATQAQATTKFYPVNAAVVSGLATEASTFGLAPKSLTLGNFFCQTQNAPGTGQSFTITLRVNGASPASGPVCTISGTNTTANDTTDTASISAGQTMDIQIVTSATAASTGAVSWGFTAQ